MTILVQLLVAVVCAAPAAVSDSPIAGTWQGKMGDVPAITVDVKDDGGKLSGTAVFYRLQDDGSGPSVAGKETAELVAPKLEGKMFSFQVKNSKGELSAFQMELTGENKATLKGKAHVTGGGDVPPIEMKRQR